MRFDGYIRVSDTKGRNGERFLSPDIQRDTIKRLAALKGVELNEPNRSSDASPRPHPCSLTATREHRLEWLPGASVV